MSLYNYSSPPSPVSQSQLLMNSNTPTPTMSNSCCENGRTIGTNPHTGQPVCSCQYTSSLLSYPRVPALGDSVYPTSAYASQGYMPLGADPSAFYPPLNGHYDIKEAGESWRGINQPAPCYPYDTPMSSFPYSNAYGSVDLNSATRRKNATRENTTTLKAWLYEHKKNPYPTKGEKIMLAIITKMTLTQVSTWFANARRRLKKENKMTWSPRNRSEDGSDGLDNIDVDSEGGKDDKDERSTPGLGDLGSGRSTPAGVDDLDTLDGKDAFINVDDEDSDDHGYHADRLDSDEEVLRRMKGKSDSEKLCDSASVPKDNHSPNKTDNRDSNVQSGGNSTGTSSQQNTEQSPRPKIWSISEFLHKTSTTTGSTSSRPAAISTHARPPHTSGLFYIPGAPNGWNGARYHGVHPYSMSLSHSTISYPYSITSHTANKSPLPSTATLRTIDSLKEGEKLMRPNVLFSPARDLDGIRPNGVPSSRLVESNI